MKFQYVLILLLLTACGIEKPIQESIINDGPLPDQINHVQMIPVEVTADAQEVRIGILNTRNDSTFGIHRCKGNLSARLEAEPIDIPKSEVRGVTAIIHFKERNKSEICTLSV